MVYFFLQYVLSFNPVNGFFLMMRVGVEGCQTSGGPQCLLVFTRSFISDWKTMTMSLTTFIGRKVKPEALWPSSLKEEYLLISPPLHLSLIVTGVVSLCALGQLWDTAELLVVVVVLVARVDTLHKFC